MNCSRCGCSSPNKGCYVCYTEPEEEPDFFSLAKNQEFLDEEKTVDPE